MSAKVSKLSKLHEMLTQAFIEDLKIARDQGIPMAASDKAVIVKFLKDNNITADPDDTKMHELDAAFQEQMRAKRTKRTQELLANDPSAQDIELAGLFM